MKRLLLIMTMCLASAVMFGQNTFKYQVVANGGLSVGTGNEKIDSIDINDTDKDYRVYGSSGDTLNPYVPYANRIEGVALADSSATAEPNSYATGNMLEDGLATKVSKADSSGITSGNYTTGYDFARLGNIDYKAIEELGGSMKGESVRGGMDNVGGLTDGYGYFEAVYVPVRATITGIKVVMSTQGNYTHDKFNGVALYSVSGGTYTRVAMSKSSVAEPNIWEAATTTLITIPFDSTGTYVAAPGVYMAYLLYNSSAQTTAPSLRGTAYIGTIWNGLLTNSNKIFGYIAGESPPASAAGSSTNAVGIGHYILLY